MTDEETERKLRAMAAKANLEATLTAVQEAYALGRADAQAAVPGLTADELSEFIRCAPNAYVRTEAQRESAGERHGEAFYAPFPSVQKVAAFLASQAADSSEAALRCQWCQPGDEKDRRWILMFAEPERGICVYTVEDEAREAFESANLSWNCYLFAAAPRTAANPAPAPSQSAAAIRAAALREAAEVIRRSVEDRTLMQKGEAAEMFACELDALAAAAEKQG